MVVSMIKIIFGTFDEFFSSDIVVIPKIVCNFAFGKVSLFKRFGRLLNKNASEPGGAEAIEFLGE